MNAFSLPGLRWVLALGLLLTAASRAAAADVELEAAEERAFRQAAAVIAPSVVQIQTVGGLDRVGELLTATGPSTGLVVGEDGYIVTSSFHFASKPASVLVVLPDGRQLAAEVIASDRVRMLTLLKVQADGLLVPQTGTTSLHVGQWGIAIGRAYEGEPSVSVGIISALNRIWGRAIQTDAKVSPVNYGGPLIDVRGQVIGVLVPLSPQGSDETAGVEWYDSGIGFAIPIADVLRSVERLKEGSDLQPGLLGVTMRGRDRFGAAVVDRVRYNSPAQQAGLQAGDEIVEVDGSPVAQQAQVRGAVQGKYAGDEVELTVVRGEDKERQTLRVTLVEELQPWESAFLGILPQRDPSPAEAGVVIRYIVPESGAARAGLRTRDRIVQIDDEEIADRTALLDRIGRYRPGETVRVGYFREDRRAETGVTLTSVPESVARPSSQAVPSRGDTPLPEGWKTGRFTGRVEGHDHNYWAYVPEDINPGYPSGLVVWIHPGGDTMEAEVFRDLKASCDQRGLILLAPKAERVSGWSPADAAFARDAVSEFVEKYNVDRQRVVLLGYGDGAPFTYFMAFRNRDLFRGAATIGGPIRFAPPENTPEERQQFWIGVGRQDAARDSVRQAVEVLQKAKFPVTFSDLPGGRTRGWPGEDAVTEIIAWIDSLDRI